MPTRIVLGLVAALVLVFAMQGDDPAVAVQASGKSETRLQATASTGVIGTALQVLPGGYFVWPLSGSAQPDTVNSPFGPRLKASDNYAYEFHPGIDLAAPEGTPIHATADGKIRLLTDLTGRRITSANAVADPSSSVLYPHSGMIVQIDHGSFIYTNSAHLSRQASGLATGSVVRRGDIIGYVGHSGSTTFDHLHFETRIGSYYENEAKNPLGYLPRTSDPTPRIVNLSAANGPTTRDVVVSIEADSQDLNFDEVVVRSFDRNGVRLDEVVVNFNDRINCGTDAPLSGRVFLEPAQFNRYSLKYAIKVSFSGVSTVSGGQIVVRVRDVSGTNEAVRSIAT